MIRITSGKRLGALMFGMSLSALLMVSCGGGGGSTNEAANPGDHSPPSNPQGLTATIISPNRIDLAWNVSSDDAGVAGYKVYRNNEYFTSTVDPAYPATGLEASTTYCFSVTAYDAAENESGQSAAVCSTTPAEPGDTQPPEIPPNLVATAVSSSQIDLSWDAATDNTGVSGYKLYRGGIFVRTVTATNVASDVNLTPNRSYCYQVSAFDAAGNESALSAQSCATTFEAVDTEPPTTPTDLSATATSSSAIGLSWGVATDNTGVSGYKIYRDASFLKLVISGTSTTDSGLSASTGYCYQVSALDAASNESTPSSQACTATQAPPPTPPLAPSDLAATAVSSSAINLSWLDHSGNETGFRIEQSSSPTSGFSVIATVLADVTNYTCTGLTPAQTYYYRVRAVNTVGYSDYTTTASATTQAAAPAAPANLAASAASSSSINLIWSDQASNETGFEIYRSTSAASGFLWIKTLGFNVTSYTDSGLSPATTYYYKIRANNSVGSSAYSNTASAATSAAWQPTTTTGAPTERHLHTAVWSGSKMIVWGGESPTNVLNTGGLYDPASNSWSATNTTNAPAARREHSAVWTDAEMLVWGGWNGLSRFNNGGRFNPSTGTWSAITTTGAPTARYGHTAVWAGYWMLIWGGNGTILYTLNGPLNTGAMYNPYYDQWLTMSTTGAPAARTYHSAVWTGSKMIVWGGNGGSGFINSGGLYDFASQSWTATTNTGAPSARAYHTAVWTGSKMIVWGGNGPSGDLNTGCIYDPATNSWTAISTVNAPAARYNHTAIWTGSKMIVWGGRGGASYLNSGGIYDPSTNSWTALSIMGAPTGRMGHTAVWIGSEMVAWGGSGTGPLKTGGVFLDGQ